MCAFCKTNYIDDNVNYETGEPRISSPRSWLYRVRGFLSVAKGPFRDNCVKSTLGTSRAKEAGNSIHCNLVDDGAIKGHLNRCAHFCVIHDCLCPSL